MNKVLKISIVVVLCLIVVLMVTLFACNNNGGGDDKKTTTTTTTTTKKPEPCTEHVDENTDGVCDVCGEPMPKEPCSEHVDEDEDGKCDVCGEDMPVVAPSDFVEVNDTVYVVATELNVRTSPSADDDKNLSGSVKYGDALTRTGYNEDGWTRIDVDGKTLYVRSTYVTTNKPIVDSDFKTVSETVYVTNKNGLKVRSTPYFGTQNDLSYLSYGDSVKRTGVATRQDDEGITWSRVEVVIEDENGTKTTVTGYASSTYLSTENPGAIDSDNGIKFETSYDILTVIATSVNLRNAAVYDSSSLATSVKEGTTLQAVAKGTESDGTVWYKVEYEDEIYYLIYNTKFVSRAEYKDETKTHKLFDGNVSITLPTYFVQAAEDELGYYYDSPDALVLVGYVTNQNPEIKSAKDLAQATLATFDFGDNDPAEVTAASGYAYFAYTTTTTDQTSGEKVTLATLAVFVKGESEGYAVVEFHCDPEDYKTLFPSFITYTKSIKVK